MERVGHTLAYDFEVLGDGTVPDANISMPAVVVKLED